MRGKSMIWKKPIAEYFLKSYEELKGWIRYASPMSNPQDAFYIDLLFSIDASVSNLKFLDNGAGNGRFSIYMAKAGLSVVALEINPVMAKKINQSKKRAGLNERVHVVIGDMQNLPFRNGIFNKVLCVHNLWYIYDYPKVAHEMLRVTRINGNIIIDHVNAINFQNMVLKITNLVRRAVKKTCPLFYRTPNTIIEPFLNNRMQIFSLDVGAFKLLSKEVTISEGLKRFSSRFIISVQKSTFDAKVHA